MPGEYVAAAGGTVRCLIDPLLIDHGMWLARSLPPGRADRQSRTGELLESASVRVLIARTGAGGPSAAVRRPAAVGRMDHSGTGKLRRVRSPFPTDAGAVT